MTPFWETWASAGKGSARWTKATEQSLAAGVGWRRARSDQGTNVSAPASQGGRAPQASDRQLHWAAQPLALAKAMPSSSATNSQRYRSVSVKEFS